MRIWHITADMLDSKRLVAAIHEARIAHKMILAGKRWGNILEPYRTRLDLVEDTIDQCVFELAVRKLHKRMGPGPYLGSILVDEEKKIREKSVFPKSRSYHAQFYSGNHNGFPTLEEEVRDLISKWRRELYCYGVGRGDAHHRMLKIIGSARSAREELNANEVVRETIRAIKLLPKKPAGVRQGDWFQAVIQLADYSIHGTTAAQFFERYLGVGRTEFAMLNALPPTLRTRDQLQLDKTRKLLYKLLWNEIPELGKCGIETADWLMG